MSASAPIKGTDKLIEEFKSAQDDKNFGFLQIGIDIDASIFECLNNVPKEKDDEATWTKMQKLTQPKNHSFFITRDLLKEGLYTLIHYGPDLSPVKQRMIYASSRSNLKQFLGSALFGEDYYINHAEEMSPKKLIEQRTLHEKIDFRSDQEVEKEQTNKEVSAKSVQAQVMKNLPIEMEDSAKQAIDNFISGNVRTIFLSLNQDNQSISGQEQKVDSVEEIRDSVPADEPRYLIFWYTNSKNENETQKIFVYYCPEKADRKLKFTYSTCKANLIEYCEQQKLEFYAKVEISDLDELSNERLDYHVFPVQEEKKEFEKPKAKGGKAKAPRKKLDV